MSEATPQTFAPVEPDPTFFDGKYPTLFELLRDGGLTGVEYCLIKGSQLKHFSKLPDSEGNVWSPIADLPALTIRGPKGQVDTVLLVGRGRPVPGAGDYNGIRKYNVSIELEEEVGIPANPDSPVNVTTNLQPEKLAKPPKSGKGGITIVSEGSPPDAA